MEVDEILNGLIPVFEDVLADKDINKLEGVLKKRNLISLETDVQTVKDKTRKISTIFESLKNVSKRGWDVQLHTLLDTVLGNVDLAKITQECFDRNKNVLWIVQNWHDLSERESTVRNAASSEKIKLPKVKWLFAFTNLVATEKRDAINAFKLIKKSLQSTQDQSHVDKSRSFSKSTDKAVSCSFSDEVKAKFESIAPLLEDCLSGEDIKKMARGLNKMKHISDGQLKKIKRIHNSELKLLLDRLTKSLQTNAKKTWKENILASIKVDKLKSIIKKWLLITSANQSGFNWLVTNWIFLKQYPNKVESIAKEKLTYSVTHKGNQPWVLDLLSHCATLPDKEVNVFATELERALIGEKGAYDPSCSSSHALQSAQMLKEKETTNTISHMTQSEDPACSAFDSQSPVKVRPVASSTPKHTRQKPLHGSDTDILDAKLNQAVQQQKSMEETQPLLQIKHEYLPNQERKSEKEQLILDLEPLLNDVVNLDKAKKVVRDMEENGHITAECLMEIEQATHGQFVLWKRLSRFLNHDQPWEIQFIASLERHVGSKLSTVVANFFKDRAKNVSWTWFIYNWALLSQNENAVKSKMFKFNENFMALFNDVSYPECLLDVMVSCHCAPEKAYKLTSTLEKSLVQKSTMELTERSFSLFDEEQQIENKTENIIPETFKLDDHSDGNDHAADVKCKLEPLVPLLSDFLTCDLARQIVRQMRGHLLKGIYKSVNAFESPTRILEVLVEGLKLNASKTWEKNFIDAIGIEDCPNLKLVVEYFFGDQSQPWSWFLYNWNNLVRLEFAVKQTVLCFRPELQPLFESSSIKNSLLRLILTCITSDEGQAVESLVCALKEQMQASEMNVGSTDETFGEDIFHPAEETHAITTFTDKEFRTETPTQERPSPGHTTGGQHVMVHKDHAPMYDHHGQYWTEVEFQVTTTVKLGSDDMICVYMDETFYPMHFDRRRKIYQFSSKTSSQSLIYKYVVKMQTSQKMSWEEFPRTSHGIQDRHRNIGNAKTKHMIIFDVVNMKPVSKFSYEEDYMHHFLYLLPSFSLIKIAENESQHIPFYTMVRLVWCWLVSRKHGVILTYTYCEIRLMVDDVVGFINQEVNALLHKNGGSQLRRVLSGLAYFIAFANFYKYVPKGYSKILCTCLSLHDVTDEQKRIIVNVYKSETDKLGSSKEVLDAIMRTSLECPEFLTALPLFQLLESAEVRIQKTKPSLPLNCMWESLIKKFQKEEFQECHQEIAGKIKTLLKQFPWLHDVYQDMLSLQTAHNLLGSPDQRYHDLFDVHGVLRKVLCFWEKAVQSQYGLSQKMIAVFCSFVNDKIDSLIPHPENDNKSVDDIQVQASNLLKQIKCLMVTWAIARTPLNSGWIIQTLPIVLRITSYAQVARQLKDNDVLTHIMRDVENKWLQESLKCLLYQSDFEIWNCLTSWKWDSNFQEKWQNACRKYMVAALQMKFKNDAQSILKFYAEKFDDLCVDKEVANVVTGFVTQTIKKQLKETHWYARTPAVLPLCMNMVQKQWREVHQSNPKATNYDIVMKFLFSWSPAGVIIRILGDKEENIELDGDTSNILSEINEAVFQLSMELLNGDITLHQLKDIIDNRNLLADMLQIRQVKGVSTDTQQLSSEQFIQVIKYRENQVKQFYLLYEAAQKLIRTCQIWFKDIVQIDEVEVRNALETDVENKKICDVIVCKKLQLPPPDVRNAATKLFGTSEEESAELEIFHNTSVLSSKFVENQMKNNAKTVKHAPLTLHHILGEIWIPAKKLALELVEAIDEGSIHFKDLNWLPKEQRQIEDQLGILYQLYNLQSKLSGKATLNGMERCLDRLKNHQKLLKNQDVVQAIYLLKEVLKLTDEFEILQSFPDLAEHDDLKLIEIDAMSNSAELFGNIHQNQLHLLVDFMEHENLLTWLVENMKDLGEVKVMSDLAMISAGVHPMEVDRVSCFLSAVMGFSPLIFDLPKDADWSRFVQACEEVWANAQRDDSLLTKWKDTDSHLEWLKATKDFHGSVENSSLTRAQLINEHGMYVIGGEETIMPTINECLQMKLLKSTENKLKEDIIMSLSELHDLQSRLMLIAGEADKGRQDVNRFIDVLSEVEKLARMYTKLKQSGCLLFANWQAKIWCSKDRKVTISVYFDSTTSAISSTGSVVKELQVLTTVLGKSHNEWIEFLHEKRDKYYHLNHFNIRQITYLCKNLAVKNERIEFPDQVYCLLSTVQESISHKDIVTTLDAATRREDTEESIDFNESTDEGTEKLIDKKKKLVRKLAREGVKENFAKAAVQKSLDFDDCFLWTLEHEFDEKRVFQLSREFDKEIGVITDDSTIDVMEGVVNNRTNLGLSQVIELIQKNINDQDGGFAKIINTVCQRYYNKTAVTSLSDCISLEHLGTFLELLSKINKQENMPDRDWPHVFIAGKPNLFNCNGNVMWRNVLSIYMAGQKPSLPTASEVLICSEATSSEDVELFLRRAICPQPDEGIRVYCLACADKLSMGLAKDVETWYRTLVQMKKNEDYRLVILTSSLQHYVSSCFEHQVLAPFMQKEEEIKSYLKTQLKVAGSKASAALIDKDQSTVRLVVSSSAGMGKSLYVSRLQKTLHEAFEEGVFWQNSVLRFLNKSANVDDIVETLYGNKTVQYSQPHFIHLDATPSLENFADKFFFELIVLGSIVDSAGVVWKKQQDHYYVIEYTERQAKGVPAFFNFLDLLPQVQCISPNKVLELMNNGVKNESILLMDHGMLSSDVYQRPYQYLLKYSEKEDLDKFNYTTPKLDAAECLQTLLKFCSIEEPSWAELYHFSSFLNVQLQDCEKSDFTKIAELDDPDKEHMEVKQVTSFVTNSKDVRKNLDDIEDKPSLPTCSHQLVEVTLPQNDTCSTRDSSESHIFKSGLSEFKKFIVKFMIRMSQDFATPSLKDFQREGMGEDGVYELHQLRRKWESTLHPYMFFNDDRTTMSFVHFNISRHGDLCNPFNNDVIQAGIMSPTLYWGLRTQGVNLQQNFDELDRELKIATLCNVFGVNPLFDPDPTYELTTDNVLKMLAIHMRFRCDIPVVIMGETGCGKTRMVEFMSKLKAGAKNDELPEEERVRNMVVVKVHGGVTVPIIHQKVEEAVALARLNSKNGNQETILFLDEANTTEAIYAIKEVVCDKTVHGEPFEDSHLKIVAACNPYCRHSDETIAAMEKSGLGFNVKSTDVTDKFAGIPMRHLVYRVSPLPPSMKPLVWDFGQLNNDTEEIYIKQMVLQVAETLTGLSREFLEVMTDILAESQRYMRKTRDMCNFVSLRDVERTIKSFKWFYERHDLLNQRIEHAKSKKSRAEVPYEIRALIQAVGMCYHSTLYQRKEYREVVARCISNLHQMTGAEIEEEIIACQSVFLNEIKLEKDIARNEALRENVFMIIVCAEMRIPLFLVGKPGSSKSLAKTIVTDAMQGRNSRSKLFQKLKQIHVLSFQCSAVSDAVGIETVFNQCMQLQKKQDMNEFVAVVVLDEIGLAEDSPKMPLKVLHPLLEVGSTKHTAFDVPENNKVGFVGISNWALDPAKMNRGIFVTRGEPTTQDLQQTAEAIFKLNEEAYKENYPIVKAVTDAYVEVCQKQTREFFGLRDYYALLKMIYYLGTQQQRRLRSNDVSLAVTRNFSGQDSNVFETFKKHLVGIWSYFQRPHTSVISLVKENLLSKHESRFLLLLTKQYAAVNLLGKVIQGDVDAKENPRKDFQVIFGSSFPRDHDYTEVCRNINKIKVCMESGTTVVLLNLQDLYESLYDALNQHYVTFADQRYVDLGLGGHRVKCRIAQNFKLIVIEEKEVVHNEFPIPLINRLEKHAFDIQSILAEENKDDAQNLNEWVENFSNIVGQNQQHFNPCDAFVGYQEDTAASAILLVERRGEQALERAQEVLLQTATLDAIVRLEKAKLREEETKNLQNTYIYQQCHDSIVDVLKKETKNIVQGVKLMELVSFSQCLNEQDRVKLEEILELPNRIKLVTLQQFQTIDEYVSNLNNFLQLAEEDNDTGKLWIMLIQCPMAQLHTKLIACAKYAAMNKVKDLKSMQLRSCIIMAFIITQERMFTKTSKTCATFYSRDCETIYVDEMHPRRQRSLPLNSILDMSISQLLSKSIKPSDRSPLDVEILLRDCIPGAMARLNSPESTRNYIKIVKDLCFEWEFCSQFRETLIEHVIKAIEDLERSTNNPWYLQEACSQKALQEGGSFCKTLWLRLLHLVGLVVSKLISIADSDRNFDIIQNCNKSKCLVDLWFTCFKAKHLCGVKWSDVAKGGPFTVITKNGFSCQFPLSRLLISQMTKQWATSAQIPSHRSILEAFTHGIESSGVIGLLNDAMACGMEDEVCSKFASDLLHILHKPVSEDNIKEIQVITDALMAVFKSKRKKQQTKYLNQLLEIFIIYKEMEPKLECLSETIAADPTVMKSTDNWIKTQEENEKITIHVSAFQSVIANLERDASDIGDLDKCHKWKKIVHDMKNVADIITETEDGFEQVIKSWKQITFLDLFINQLVPRTTKYADEYLKTIAPLARRLWKGASKVKDISDLHFLKIITNILQGCTKVVEFRIKCNWQDYCQVCHCEKMTDPVKLPCGHQICKACVAIDEGDVGSCPICRKPVPNVQQLQPLTLTEANAKEFEMFKMATTTVFLDYLSTLCFPSPQAARKNSNLKPPDEKILWALENLIVFDGKTQKISPHLDSFDKSPTARSFLLQLLLRCDKTQVQNQLEQHFTKIEGVVQNRSLLVNVYIQTIQDMLHSRSFALNDGTLINTEFVAGILKNALQVVDRNLNQIEHLDLCSELQYVSSTVAECLHVILSGEVQHTEQVQYLIDMVSQTCQGENFATMKEYIIKILCRRYGMDAFELLLKDQNYGKFFIPVHLIPQLNEDHENYYLHADSFTLAGKTYAQTKDILLNITQSHNIENATEQVVAVLEANGNIIHIMLALSVWATRSNISGQLRKKAYDKITQKLNIHLPERCDKQLFKDISVGTFDSFVLQHVTKLTQHKLTELIILSGLVYSSSGHGLLKVFEDVISVPKSIATTFLPTMPQSNYFDVKDFMDKDVDLKFHVAPKLYMCPNNHPYFIGECTNPVQAGRCPECNERIGGQEYGLLHEGNKVGDLTEESQAGYLLPTAKDRKGPNPERGMTKLSVCATRACLHLAMLHATRKGKDLHRTLKLKSQNGACTFVMEHLMTDLKHLAQCTGKSIDDAILLMHEILHSMQLEDGNEVRIENLETRKQWEKAFQKEFLSPIFKDTDNVIINAQQKTIDAVQKTPSPLHRLINEYNLNDDFPQGMIKWNCPELWKCRTRITVQHLRLTLEGIDENTGDGAVLKMVLNTEHLGEIEHLTTILNVQLAFIQRYRHKVDMADSEKETIQQFLSENSVLKSEIDQYIKVWDKVKHNLAAIDKYNTLRVYFTENMTLESPISMCLPSKRGRGCCALLLTEYLIEKQNDILLQYKEMKQQTSFRQIDTHSVTHNKLICINENRDLLPLILANAQYEATLKENGPKYSIAYNLELLEQKIEEQFILRKCLIKKETIPHMTYPQDVGLGKICGEIQDKQKTLPLRLCQMVDTYVQNARTADICDAVRTLTFVIQFFAKIGGSLEQSVCDYAERDLLLTNDQTSMLPRSAKLCHVTALYERYSWHKAVRAIKNDQNPYEVLNIITEMVPSAAELDDVLKQVNIERLQIELNALLMVGPELCPEWRLGETLKAYIDGKISDEHAEKVGANCDTAWCDKIPDDVCIKHAKNVLALSIKHMVVIL